LACRVRACKPKAQSRLFLAGLAGAILGVPFLFVLPRSAFQAVVTKHSDTKQIWKTPADAGRKKAIWPGTGGPAVSLAKRYYRSNSLSGTALGSTTDAEVRD